MSADYLLAPDVFASPGRGAPRWYALTFHDDAHWALFSQALATARGRAERPNDIRVLMRHDLVADARVVYITCAAYLAVKQLAQVFGVKRCPRPEGKGLDLVV